MPSTGVYAPSPERYGGGDGGSGKTLLQRVFESLASQRGSAYDQTLSSKVGVESMAYARAITFDGYGANQRLANNFLPSRMTAAGTLGRWEKILGLVVYPTDTEAQRRARVAAKLSMFGKPNSVQPVVDALTTLLGSLFVGLVHQSPAASIIWWPGNSGTTAAITSDNPPYGVTVSNLPSSLVNAAWYGMTLTLSNTANGNDGSYFITSATSGGTTANADGPNVSPTVPDYGIGGTAGAPTIRWAVTNPNVVWSSSVAHFDIQLAWVAGYYTVQGGQNVPNALFYSTVAQIGPVLDEILPAWTTWDWFLPNQQGGGGMGFYADEPNADIECVDP